MTFKKTYIIELVVSIAPVDEEGKIGAVEDEEIMRVRYDDKETISKELLSVVSDTINRLEERFEKDKDWILEHFKRK